MLELAILGLLLESPMHGYELRKRLTGLLGAFRAFSYGSLYPALRRMQADGLIEEDAAPGINSAATMLRRGKRVYQLTTAGRPGSASWWRTPGHRTTPTTASACTWRSSTARRPRPGCGSSKAAAGR
ncbi:Putative transcriptional regulator%2C PadR family [Mycobacteroides abscessus]|nr:Putative transcriptional regulator%2C PadR family [Mycobacteroides abscessus]